MMQIIKLKINDLCCTNRNSITHADTYMHHKIITFQCKDHLDNKYERNIELSTKPNPFGY